MGQNYRKKEEVEGGPGTHSGTPAFWAAECAHEWKHLHDTAYGLESTHMAGSERFECVRCPCVVHGPDPKFPSLVFVLDHVGTNR